MMDVSKPLAVPFIPGVDQTSRVALVSDLLDALPNQTLQYAPWAKYPYKPDVQFSIGHSNDCLLLKYNVKEKVVKAACYLPNSPVYTDSCVEFFIEMENGKGYYNFEFNCIGTNLCGFGPGRADRTPLPEQVTSHIKYQVFLHNEAGIVDWSLTIMLPLRVFCFHSIPTLHRLRCSANFYKCGDDLPEPHFLSWAPVRSPSPNFHLPEFFGTVHFE